MKASGIYTWQYPCNRSAVGLQSIIVCQNLSKRPKLRRKS